MKKSSILKAFVAAALAVSCLGVVAGCGNGDGLTGGVAATVNGVEIPEDKVTKQIQQYRKNYGVTKEADWGKWMADANYTPKKFRDDFLDTLIEQEVLRQEASEMGLAVSQDEIDGYVQKMRDNYASDEAWQEALDAVGLTEEEYAERIEIELLKQGVEAKLAEETANITDGASYYNAHVADFQGLRKSSHILFEEGDEATAQDVLSRIKSGELSFEDAVAQYSTDTGSAPDGGNVGWGAPINSFITEYSDAVAKLNAGQVSDLVPSQYGIHIIKVTEVFTPPASINSTDQLPTEIAEYVTTQVDNASNSAYQDWLQSARDAREIVINPMPQNVPYNVDMTKYMDAETLAAIDAEETEEQEEFVEDMGDSEAVVDAVTDVEDLAEGAEEGAQHIEEAEGEAAEGTAEGAEG